MKRCIGSAKPHRAVFRLFARYYDAEEVIHQRISSNWQYISNSGPKAMPKTIKNWFMSAFPQIENVSQTLAPNPQNLTEPLFAFLLDITMLKNWFIRAFPIKNWTFNEKVHRILKTSYGPEEKAMPKSIKNWIFNEKVHRTAKPHRAVFRFFARYYDAEDVIHKRISWNSDDISNSGPKTMPKIIKNWTFNEKVHRIGKSSQSRFSLFCKILRCWRSDS